MNMAQVNNMAQNPKNENQIKKRKFKHEYSEVEPTQVNILAEIENPETKLDE